MIELLIATVLFVLGLVFGTLTERRHFADIARREQALRHILLFNEKRVPATPQFAGGGVLVCGSMVVAEDYFKRAAATLKSFFGGRLTVYESLLDRARREAILRMKEQAERIGASAVFNVCITTSMLSEDQPNALACCEIMAYGSAVGIQSGQSK